MAIKTYISITENLWRQHPNISQKIKSLLKNIIPQTPLQIIINKKINLEISVLLTNNQQIQELNKNYRQKNQPTNTLSFPLLDHQKIKNGNLNNINPITNHLALGDIILSYQTILQESQKQNKSFEHHLFHLITHSLLHLIGFDHIKENNAKSMEDLEIRILSTINIKNPYLQ